MVVSAQAAASSEERPSGGLKSFITVAFHSSSYQWKETPFIGKVVPPVGPAKDNRPRVRIGSHWQARKITVSTPTPRRVMFARGFQPSFIARPRAGGYRPPSWRQSRR